MFGVFGHCRYDIKKIYVYINKYIVSKKKSTIVKVACVRALVLVILKNYIVIFSTTKYKFITTLVEPKPNNLAPQI